MAHETPVDRDKHYFCLISQVRKMNINAKNMFLLIQQIQ